ncbi:MAG: Uma2 family endonuclease [Polyangiaceae bacterium]
MADAAERLWSPDEYLAWERAQPTKHDYVDGAPVAMAGASARHNLIAANVVGEVREALRSKSCSPFPSDMRVRIPATGGYRYPDASIACEPIQFEDDAVDTLKNPSVIIKILSPTTEAEDRGRKFREYRTLPSLRDYLLVSQDEIWVEHWFRQDNGVWALRDVRAGERVQLASCGVELRVDELYLKVFPPPEGAAEAAS